MSIFQACVWYWNGVQSWIQYNGGYTGKISANNLLKMSNNLCTSIISCKIQKLSLTMTYVIYDIYVTPFLNKNRINIFTAFVCNLDGLYKKLKTLFHLFFQEIVCDYIHSNKIEANQFHNNKPGVDGSKTVLFGKLILVILSSSMTFTSNVLRLDLIFTYLPACLPINM